MHKPCTVIDSTYIARKRVTSVLLASALLTVGQKIKYCKFWLQIAKIQTVKIHTKAGTIVENSAKLLSCLNIQSCNGSVS